MIHKTGFVYVLAVLFLLGCASRYPTEREWKKTPILQKDEINFKMQGNFETIGDFLKSAGKLKNGLSLENTDKLGFTTEGKNGCEKIGWLDASNILLSNIQLGSFSSVDAVIAEKRQYEAVSCEVIDSKTRTDRQLAYFNNLDSYKTGRRAKVILVFKNKILVGVNINNQPIREHDRKSAFASVLGDLFTIFPINPTRILP